ncbi:hypothetical protein [Ralstonia pseudosolanacearum]|uniref:Uncharacterized protein n=1 Tax=Ralstonia solanacearum TaxID=305 RepID=A0ABY6NKJ9_RALSL|nr:MULTISPECIES: hypothetical protein [Ralstonia]QWQ14053.1 hypothetical protein KN198_24350 [Ralstonia solanacearum]MDO3623199.1 hypothetical protein [Ralstonia pseudosolanacearum]UZF17833.1 hypothetical protein LH706_20055 [Ralstonia solanacearum]UZF27472.1 hypothetical protein LGV80_25740 [Ralstonia sp. RS642]UZF32605.1 hypothetical protein LGV82_18185 [Ralstonia sp. RS650]
MIIHNDIEKFIDLNPSSYRFLKAISFARSITEEECSCYDVEIVLCKISHGKVEDLTIRCVDALDVRVGGIEGMFGMQLEIEDISSWQNEGANFKVSEHENNAISFNCREFYVTK